MSFPDDTLAPEDRCEICGMELGDEIVIQEFADGSLARLCPECAAGAALEALEDYEAAAAESRDEFGSVTAEIGAAASGAPDSSFVFPEPEEEPTITPFEDSAGRTLGGERAGAALPEPEVLQAAVDPLEKTRELLTPVEDLIVLQREMQEALHRLATSLQVFASDVIAEKLERAVTVESRVESLERELEQTRARLRETEALLAAATAGQTSAVGAESPTPTSRVTGWPPFAGAPLVGQAAVPVLEEPAVARAAEPDAARAAEPATGEVTQPVSALASVSIPAEPGPEGEPTLETEALASEQPAAAADRIGDLARPGVAPLSQSAPPLAVPPVPPPADAEGRQPLEYHAFELAEVQIAQRYYNESPFTQRIRDVRHSLGKPRVNLTKLPGAVPRALLTIAWDIVWYQYLIDLRRDIPSDQRVVLHREGLDLDELASLFKEKNASIDDQGRLDASELEVKLLSDPTILLTELTPEEEQALEDATEEIWDQHTAPEFKWDD